MPPPPPPPPPPLRKLPEGEGVRDDACAGYSGAEYPICAERCPSSARSAASADGEVPAVAPPPMAPPPAALGRAAAPLLRSFARISRERAALITCSLSGVVPRAAARCFWSVCTSWVSRSDGCGEPFPAAERKPRLTSLSIWKGPFGSRSEGVFFLAGDAFRGEDTDAVRAVAALAALAALAASAACAAASAREAAAPADGRLWVLRRPRRRAGWSLHRAKQHK